MFYMQYTNILFELQIVNKQKKKGNLKYQFRAAKELKRKDKNMTFRYEKCPVIL